jgi:hypothetical protein
MSRACRIVGGIEPVIVARRTRRAQSLQQRLRAAGVVRDPRAVK